MIINNETINSINYIHIVTKDKNPFTTKSFDIIDKGLNCFTIQH